MAVANILVGWPIRFTATTYVLRVTLNSVTSDLTFPASGALTLGRNYYLAGDGQADADGGVGGVGDLLALLAACLNSHPQAIALGITFTVTINASWRVEITASANTFQLLWSHVNTTLDESIFGFANASSPLLSPAITTAGGLLPKGLWRPNRAIAVDSRDRQSVVGGIASAISGLQRTSSLALPLKQRDIAVRHILARYALDEYANVAEPTGAFEYAWINALSLGRAFRLYLDEAVRTSNSYAAYRVRDLEDPLARNGDFQLFWDVALQLVRAA